MNYLEKLLNGTKVAWKTLGSVSEIKRGTTITKKKVVEGNVPVIAGGQTHAYYHNESNRAGQSIVIAGSGAYAGFVSWWEDPIFVSDAFTVKPHEGLLPKYCFYFLEVLQQQLHDFKSRGGVPHVYPKNVAPLEIPIPCPDDPKKSLEIQAEIVRILNTFTSLIAELTTELAARKKQYEYYRNQLLTFSDDEVSWLPLGDLTTLKRGRIMSKEYLIDNIGDFPVYSSQTAKNGMIGEINTFDFDGEYISWTTDGANAGTVFHRTEKFSITNICGLIKINDEIKLNYKFLFYWLSIEAKKHVYSGMGNPKLMNYQVEKISVPIPYPDDPKKSLEIQAEIVRILNTFTSLIAELTTELAARKKQYEYYRNQLLNFPKTEKAKT